MVLLFSFVIMLKNYVNLKYKSEHDRRNMSIIYPGKNSVESLWFPKIIFKILKSKITFRAQVSYIASASDYSVQPEFSCLDNYSDYKVYNQNFVQFQYSQFIPQNLKPCEASNASFCEQVKIMKIFYTKKY